MYRNLNLFVYCAFALLGAFLCPGEAKADTHTALTCSLSDVTAAYNAATNGDVVAIPNGTCTWTNRLSISKQITLQGNGTSNTIIQSSGNAVYLSANNIRITSIHFASTGNGNSNHMIEGHGTNIRIDHNLFTGSVSMHIYFVDPYHSTGVVDSNTFSGDIRGQVLYVRDTDSPSTFANPIDFGSADWVFFEGNSVISTNREAELIETQAGGKIVSRWNTINGSAWGWIWEQHNISAMMVSGTGGRAHEAYNNLIKPSSGSQGGGTAYLRNGTGLFYNNITDYSLGGTVGSYILTAYRAAGGINHNEDLGNYDCADSASSTANVPAPGLCPTCLAKCCSQAYTSGSLSGEGYPCVSQTGMGGDSNLSDGVWNPAHEPIYFWNNKQTANGTTMVDQINIGTQWDSLNWAIALDRDYCISNSGKPASCGGHALNYTPYTCPHPLTGYTGTCDTNVAGAAGYNVSGTPDTESPTWPTGTTFSANATSSSSITVSWSAATDNVGVTGYIVERCQGTGCSNFTQVGTPTASPFVDFGLTPSTFYNYHVRARDAAGNLSGWSNVVGATTQAGGGAGEYWVSPTGAAAWANCKSSTALSGASACSLATANTNSVAGDTINLRGGTYSSSYIAPSNSGTASQNTTYQNYGSETVTISGQAYGVYLVGRSYVHVKGVTVVASISGTSQPLLISNGNYNIIENSSFSGGSDYWGSEIINNSTYNWIKGSTFTIGARTAGGVLAIGTEDVSNDASRFNLVENCTMYDGEHHVLAIESGENTIRNNHLQNADGTQRVFILYGSTHATGIRNIVEGNFIGYANLQTDASANAGMTLSAAYNIIRYNQFLKNTEAGVSLYTSSGYLTVPSYNALYNNTFFDNSLGGDQDGCGMNFLDAGNSGTIQGNQVKNNIFYSNGATPCSWRTYGGVTIGLQTFANNFADANGNPLFVDSTGTDPTSTTLPNLHLQSSSSAINFGTYLTQASGSGSNFATLAVVDAGYFQDGTYGPPTSISADWIAIGSVSNTVQISSINYTTNTITLSSPMSWSANAPIWLYKKSDGVQVLSGSAPDAGAFEYIGGGSGTTPCNTVTTSNFSQAAYNAYGAPYDLFAANAQLVDAKCTSADTHTINATIGKMGDTTRIVYTRGYYFDPGINNWAQYTGTCTGTPNGDWCAGPVTATITDADISTASAAAPAYFVGMVCSVQGGSWRCGCRDTNCTNFYWQIQGAGQ